MIRPKASTTWQDVAVRLLEALEAIQAEIEKAHELAVLQHELLSKRIELLDARLSELEGKRETLQ